MYEFAYNEIVEESAQAMRACEARALDRVIGMLRDAEPSGPKSRQGINALYQLRTLWTVFLDDLSGSENALPATLRAASSRSASGSSRKSSGCAPARASTWFPSSRSIRSFATD